MIPTVTTTAVTSAQGRLEESAAQEKGDKFNVYIIMPSAEDYEDPLCYTKVV